MTKLSVTFKKNARETGLRAVSDVYPSHIIKINRIECGSISYVDATQNWQVGIQAVDTKARSGWSWLFFKKRFGDADEARAWFKTTVEAIHKKWPIYVKQK